MNVKPTTVWVILAKERNGTPANFAHSTQYIHLTQDEAIAEHAKMGRSIKEYFSIKECVIMDASQYNPG